MPSLSKIKIRIWSGLAPTDRRQLELHPVSDASQYAYAAAAYITCILNKSVTYNFVLGKLRVTPIKQTSVSVPELGL